MKTVSILTRSLHQHSTSIAFADLKPDISHVCAVQPGQHRNLISSAPLTAGNEFHRLLGRMGDDGPLTAKEKAYLPWMKKLRTMVWNLGAWQMDMESALAGVGNVPGGVCDLLIHGGPQRHGIIEVKVIVEGTCEKPRSRDCAQLGAYTRNLAGDRSFDRVWAGLAYIELETGLVRLFVFQNARQLVTQTISLLRAA